MRNRYILLALLAFSLIAPAAFAHAIGGKDAEFVRNTIGADPFPFLYLGAKHMVTGYDHLLFLTGVIFFLYRLKDVLLYVTLFSLGHSTTLILGVLFDFGVSAHLVDMVIGLSVSYKAFENLGGFRKLGFELDNRIAFGAFGLSGGGAAGTAQGPVTVLAGSELRDVEPQLLKAAADAGVPVKLSYAGTLDIVERVNAGEAVDMILPPSGAYPSLALATPPRAREKLFYSRVVLGVRSDKARALGWDRRAPAWTDIARAAGAGQLHFAMTNPTSSNTGMSALFAVASAVAGKTEDLSEKEVNGTVLKAFLAGQTLTAGSSGWLAEAYARTDWRRFSNLPAFEAANRINAYGTYLLLERESLAR